MSEIADLNDLISQAFVKEQGLSNSVVDFC